MCKKAILWGIFILYLFLLTSCTKVESGSGVNDKGTSVVEVKAYDEDNTGIVDTSDTFAINQVKHIKIISSEYSSGELKLVYMDALSGSRYYVILQSVFTNDSSWDALSILTSGDTISLTLTEVSKLNVVTFAVSYQ